MNNYELICLALEEIRRQAYNSQQLVDNLGWVVKRKKGQELDESLRLLLEESEQVLKEALATLRDKVLEQIAEYNNGIDNVGGVDVALSKVAFDLIYERAKANDYE
ncbi:hypothetical protein ACGE0T_14175 [Parabacteroides sp. APC149_11_2_Y6]